MLLLGVGCWLSWDAGLVACHPQPSERRPVTSAVPCPVGVSGYVTAASEACALCPPVKARNILRITRICVSGGSFLTHLRFVAFGTFRRVEIISFTWCSWSAHRESLFCQVERSETYGKRSAAGVALATPMQ